MPAWVVAGLQRPARIRSTRRFGPAKYSHGRLGPTELRLMQGLAQQVTALRPDLLNADATVGELAWGDLPRIKAAT
ncbi:hypothetical protein KXS07_02125 [Inquilinus limosus]|uniref:hypothetical protein n=1 Tax=Inquilinus limosus TaxID=171674 RepID=UPI003F186FE6